MFISTFLEQRAFKFKCPQIGPDFMVKLASETLWLEAVAPSLSDELKRLSEIKDPPEVYSVPSHEYQSRYTSALLYKKQKVDKYIDDEIIKGTDQIIIAINGAHLGLDGDIGISQQPVILEVLFGIGPISITINRESNKAVDMSLTYEEFLEKKNGAKVEKQIFWSGEYRNISAVLHSNTNPWYTALHGKSRNVILVHNPFAKNPIKNNLFKGVTEFFMDTENGEIAKFEN